MGFFDDMKKKSAEKKAREAQERERQAQERERKEKLVRDVKIELREKMAASPVINMIFTELAGEEFAFCRQGTEDDGRRRVILSADIFEVKWAKVRQEYVGSNSLGIAKTEPVEVIFGRAAYSYTKSGYAPLSAYQSRGVTIPQHEVIQLWTVEIQNRFKQMIPKCSFEGTKNGFFYTLPQPERQMF